MRTHRFGRKIKLPATIAIKHPLRKLMFEDSVKKTEAEARAEVLRGQGSYLKKSLDRNTTGPSASTGPFEELT